MKTKTLFGKAYPSRVQPVWPKGQAAFTMVEIALALAVIGFALVAIIGILPAGMNVQKENREDTIINQDAAIWIEAIRNGARGFDDLKNYVDAISVTWVGTVFDAAGAQTGPSVSAVYNIPTNAFSTGEAIVGLLSTPSVCYYDKPQPGWVAITNIYVSANVRAMNGVAVDKQPQRNPDVLLNAFSYKLISEVVPCTNMITGTLQTDLYELRLTFRWPLLPNGNTGPRRQTFRTLVGGHLVMTVTNGFAYFHFNPTTYVQSSKP